MYYTHPQKHTHTALHHPTLRVLYPASLLLSRRGGPFARRAHCREEQLPRLRAGVIGRGVEGGWEGEGGCACQQLVRRQDIITTT